MNILLAAVNAKYIHSNLAVYSLKASAGKFEPQVTLAEYTINHQTDDIFQDIFRRKPDLLFLSCYIWNRQVITETAENIRKVLPETVIWAGGPEVSYDAQAFLWENPAFDGVMIGEGEKTFRYLLQHYVEGSMMLEQITGIAYRKRPTRIGESIQMPEGRLKQREISGPEEDVIVNGSAGFMQTLDELPFVYQNLQEFENRIIYYETSRGCPFSCSYCLSSIDKGVRFRSLDLVKRELEFFLEQKIPQVKFVDRTFNCNHTHAMEIWKFILEHDNGITNFHFEIAADLLNEEELEILSRMRPGLVQLEIGVQTVNDRTLEAIHRTARFEKIVDRVQKIAAHRNIHQHLDLIAGLPYEDFESFRTSFDAVYSMRPQELQLGFLKVLKGSEMHQRAAEYGIISRSLPPYEVLATRWISCDELLQLKEVEEMLEVYYNSQQFRCTVTALEKLFDRPFDLYAALADYYKEEKLNGKSWSRMQRFVHLRRFICSFAAQEGGYFSGWIGGKAHRSMEYFDQLLTLDFYLRENAKTRPQWAVDQSIYKEWMAQFYRQEEQERAFLPFHKEMNWKQLQRMTHLERFDYDVLGNGEKKILWLLFDYAQRDPLTYDAVVSEVTLPVQDVLSANGGCGSLQK